MLNSMQLDRNRFADAAFWATCAIPVAVLVSIAASQVLIGVALLCLLISGAPLRLPAPIRLPLAAFIGGTLVAWLASGDLRGGLPQIRKFFVFLVLVLVYSTLRTTRQVRWLVLACAAVAAISALLSFLQFFAKYRTARNAHQPFYQSYVGERITGFMSHWMTLGGEEMIVLLLAGALLLFACVDRRWKLAAAGCTAALAVSMVLGFTRSVWLGTLAGGMYLLWAWRRVFVVAVPLLMLASLAFGPVRERLLSVVRPHGETDSNQFRVVVWRTGLRMVRVHPWLGLGPEGPRRHFSEYLPADIPRPLPPGYYGHLHNIYLQYAAERGIPTMLALMWLIGRTLFDCAGTLRRGVADADARFILHGAIAAIIAVLIAGFAEYNLGDSEVLTLFLTTVACAYIAVEGARARAA